jgi:catechol 2,3-dioxygenase-like lactoylglutathione lyase family enzyme
MIDHVELFVPDRYAAAQWYERALGLTILREYESWASDPRGPLMISGDSGATKLALFQGAPPPHPDSGFRRVAFRLDGSRFAETIRRLGELHVHDSQGRPVSPAAVVDHGKAFSVYFSDPYGHQLEVTTYDHAAVVAGTQR